MKHIRVFAPGTVANLGCGFDVMGLTLDGVGDLLEIGAEEGAEGLEIRNLSGMNLPENIEENVITPALRAMLAAYGRPVRIEVTMLEKIAPGSGIGSSAASSAAAVYGFNELLDRPFSGKELVEFAMMGEALIGGTPHADNVGPAVLGGVVLIRGYEPFDIVRLPVPDNFFYAVAHPAIVVSTKDAREVLPREIPLSKAVEQWGNVGGLVAGFALRDVALIGRSMHDAVVEPYRKGFIPGYDELKELVLAHEKIIGVHDLILHNYGPGRTMGSCHVEVRSDSDFVAVHEVVDLIEREIEEKLHILMTIHMDPVEVDNAAVNHYRHMAEQVIAELHQNLSLHDFRLVSGENTNRLIFDILVPFDCTYTNDELLDMISGELSRMDKTCQVSLTFDRDFT